MTREEAYTINNEQEAIRELEIIRRCFKSFSVQRQALSMAIEALAIPSAEPCDDAISRQAVLDLVVANHTELNGVNVVMYSPFYKDIKQLPPVKPQEPKTDTWSIKEVADALEKHGLMEQEPYEDFIDRADAMTEIMMFAGNEKNNDDIYIKVSDAVQLLRELPSVEQEPKTDILDKIKAEIETDLSHFCFDDWGNENSEWKEVKAIIDKYKQEG